MPQLMSPCHHGNKLERVNQKQVTHLYSTVVSLIVKNTSIQVPYGEIWPEYGDEGQHTKTTLLNQEHIKIIKKHMSCFLHL